MYICHVHAQYANEAVDQQNHCPPNSFADVRGFCKKCQAGEYMVPQGVLFTIEETVCSPYIEGQYQQDFADLIRLDKPYIVSTADDWNLTTGHFDSVCGVEVCAGNTGVNDKTSLTVLALIPKNVPNLIFASESSRRIYAGSSVRPTYNSTGGPTGNGDVKFDRIHCLVTDLMHEWLLWTTTVFSGVFKKSFLLSIVEPAGHVLHIRSILLPILYWFCEVSHVSGLSMLVTAKSLSAPSCSVVEGVTEDGAIDDNTDIQPPVMARLLQADFVRRHLGGIQLL